MKDNCKNKISDTVKDKKKRKGINQIVLLPIFISIGIFFYYLYDYVLQFYIAWCLLWFAIIKYIINDIKQLNSELARNPQNDDYKPFSCYDSHEINQNMLLLNSVILLPIRMIGIIVMALVYIIQIKLLYLIFKDKQRSGLGQIMTQIFINLCGRFGFFLFGWWPQSVKQQGKTDKDYQDCPIIVSNHQTMFDWWTLGAMQNTSFIYGIDGFEEYISILLTKVNNSLIFKRGEKNSREKLIESIKERIVDQNELRHKVQVSQLCIFAEGCQTNGKYMGHFRQGAFINQESNVQPIYMKHNKCPITKYSIQNTIIPFYQHMFLVLSTFQIRTDCQLLNPVNAKKENFNNADEYRLHVENMQRKELNVEFVDVDVRNNQKQYKEIIELNK